MTGDPAAGPMLTCGLSAPLRQVSVSCGIPDFRSRDGIYARLAVDFPDLPDPQVSQGHRARSVS